MEQQLRQGILAGGNWILDFVKVIDVYPKQNALANILEQKSGNGGAPFSVLKAIHKMGFSFPLEGIGRVGDDEMGEEILKQCGEMQIESRQIMVSKGAETSYTDVMTVKENGRRTFFHFRGANALLKADDFDFSASQAKIFHLGYLLLLDGLDLIGSDGLSGAAEVFKQAQKAGLMTSADIVSEQSKRYKEVVTPSLPYLDILFINEFEAKKLTGIKMFDKAGNFLAGYAYQAAEAILSMGVRQWVVIHFPTGAIALDIKGQRLFQPAVDIPGEMIKGTVGAGDAFAAGVLAGLHEKWGMERSLILGVCVAAVSLQDNTASESIVGWEKCLTFGESFGYKECFIDQE